VLTLDLALQRTAEELLRRASERRTITSGTTENSSDPFFAAGGAIAVMDVRDGAIRAAAATPTFDPNLLVGGKTKEIAALLADKTHPLFDRVCRMALPPGSTFKVLTAVALLESAAVGPHDPFVCQGYLHQPDRQRCEIYVRQGVGHGQLALADALAVSCNVYFFRFAGQMGPRRWSIGPSGSVSAGPQAWICRARRPARSPRRKTSVNSKATRGARPTHSRWPSARARCWPRRCKWCV